MRELVRLWALVLVANIAGAALFSAFAAYLGPALGIIEPATFGEMAHPKISHPAGLTFASAIGAGWLMGLLSWLVIAARDTISQVFAIWVATMTIALTKLHHSIAGSVDVLMAVFAGVGPTPGNYAHFLVWAVLGNAVGGALFVALLKFGSVRTSQDEG